jgi:hypothetical protein
LPIIEISNEIVKMRFYNGATFFDKKPIEAIRLRSSIRWQFLDNLLKKVNPDLISLSAKSNFGDQRSYHDTQTALAFL